MVNISNVIGRQIFDSRGIPTLEVDVFLEDNSFGRASVPSGASTGTYEAFELRDNDKSSYFGKSVFKAVEIINSEIFDLISGIDASRQREIDSELCSFDGTKNKSRLGANSMLAVSLAVARAASVSKNLPLFSYLGGINSFIMPTPLINIINGGAHANNSLNFQEFMIAPVGASTFTEALKMSMEVFLTLREILKKKGLSIAVGDEGGFAPELKSEEEAIILIENAVKTSGYNLGKDFYIALDIAANELFKDNLYSIKYNHENLTTDEVTVFWQNFCKNYPIFSLEDPFSENDWKGFSDLTNSNGKNLQIVGDDLFVTNKEILAKGIKNNSCNAILIKPNQIGTLTETLETINLAKCNNYEVIISHRSGETEDNFIADLSVAVNASQIKTGSLSRSERLSKYNQLLRIEELLGETALFSGEYLINKYS